MWLVGNILDTLITSSAVGDRLADRDIISDRGREATMWILQLRVKASVMCKALTAILSPCNGNKFVAFCKMC